MNDAGASKAALQTTQPTRVLVLSGGVGGAKLALGLARVLPPRNTDHHRKHGRRL